MRFLAKYVLPLLVLAAGVAGAMYLISKKPEAKRAPHGASVPLVEVLEMAPTDTPVMVTGMGAVMAARQVVVQPQITGRLVEVHPRLEPGSVLAAGEVVARVDARDYELAIEQQSAQIERARFEIEVELGRKRIAEHEWKLLEEDVPTTDAGRALALRLPHLRNARASLAAARSGLAQAKLNVERTTITVPFNAVVQEEAAELGQIVTPQSRLATLAGTDQFWVEVSLPVGNLLWVDVPGVSVGREEPGSRAVVIHETATGLTLRREGRVVRLRETLDPLGRMARVVVAVDDPLATGGDKPPLPLFIGAYVRVEIEGRPLKGVFEVPRVALREGTRVWLLTAQDTLAIRDVTIAWRTRDVVYVTGGVAPGDRLITNRVATPVEGMSLRLVGAPTTAPDTSEPAVATSPDPVKPTPGTGPATAPAGTPAAAAEPPAGEAAVTAEANEAATPSSVEAAQ